MNKSIHFFDLDGTLWKVYGNAWIVLKSDTSKPFHILNSNELNDIVLGLNRQYEIDIDYDDQKYWLSEVLFEKLKKKRKNLTKDMLGLSFIEMKNPEYFKKITFFLDNIKHLSNTQDIEVGLLSARHNEKNDNKLLSALNDELNKLNITVKKFYYLCDTYQNRVSNAINFNKMNVLLEHMVGFKIKKDKFIPLKQDIYDDVHFYDDEFTNINICDDIQIYFDEYLKNSDDEVYDKIQSLIKSKAVKLTTHLITNNQLNRFKNTTITLKKSVSYPVKITESVSILKYQEFITKKI